MLRAMQYCLFALLKPRLRSWCSCMAVTSSRLSMLFVYPMLPWFLRDSPIAHGSSFRMLSLLAIIPSSANSLEMACGLLFSEETQNPRSRVVAKDHLHAATRLIGLNGSSAEITWQGSSNSESSKYGLTRQCKAKVHSIYTLTCKMCS